MGDRDKVAGASSSGADGGDREQDAPATDGLRVVGASSSRAVAEGREQDAPATCVQSPWPYFNPRAEIDIRSGGNLPHWEQGSVWYFVTFRLADALPVSVVRDLMSQRETWKREHNLDKLTRDEIAEYHRLFSERYESLLHASNGSCILREKTCAEMIDRAIRFFRGQRYDLDEIIVMPNHVHLLVKPFKGYPLRDILHSWKSYSANQINRHLGRAGQLWQHEYYDHIVRNPAAMDAIRKYIRENPSMAGGKIQVGKRIRKSL